MWSRDVDLSLSMYVSQSMVGHAQPTVDLFTHYAAAGAVWPTGESANNAPELVQRLFRTRGR